MKFSAERVFALLVRAYSRRTQARFRAAMRHALECEWQSARASGSRAILRFWYITIVDTIRFAIADRAGGLTKGRPRLVGTILPMHSRSCRRHRDDRRSGDSTRRR
jgi:hypothetical protein